MYRCLPLEIMMTYGKNEEDKTFFSPVFISCMSVLWGIFGVWWDREDCVRVSCNLLSVVHWIYTHIRKTWQIILKCWIWVVNTWVFILLFSACVLSRFSRVQLFETPWTVAPQAPPSMGFSRQEYWSGVSCPPAGGPPHPGTGLTPPVSPVLQADSSPLSCLGSPFYFSTLLYIWKFS